MKQNFKKMPDEEWQKAWDRAWKAIMDADYKKAVGILAPAYNKYPEDFRTINFYASTLADFGEFQTPQRKRALKGCGCALLRGLLTRLRGVSRGWAYSTRNEYYYHSEKFDKQYALGKERVHDGDKSGYYSQGVGAAWHAYSHARNGRRHFAILWAKRAVCAWKNYFKFKADYYNAYMHYALALGILGRESEMEAALKKSGRLGGKPDSYHEFKDVREKVSKLKNNDIQPRHSNN